MSASPYKQLEQEFKRLHAFRGALSLLRWDAAVMMPRGSAEIRGEQLAALETEYHALLTSPRITRLLDRAQANAQTLIDWQVANLREMRRQRDHAIATPVSLISRLARATSRFLRRWPAPGPDPDRLVSRIEQVRRRKALPLLSSLGLWVNRKESPACPVLRGGSACERERDRHHFS